MNVRTKVIVACAVALAVGVIAVGIATAAEEADPVAVTECLAERGVDGGSFDELRAAVDACAAPLREELGDAAECMVERRPNLLDLDALRAAAETCGLGEGPLRERLELERGALSERVKSFTDCLADQGVVLPTEESELGSALLSLLGIDGKELKAAYEACRGELPLAPSLDG
jgi:hypothetical protein